MQRLITFGLTMILSASIAFGQNNSNAANKADTIKPGDNLVIQGIPPVPAELAAAVKKYTESIPVSFSDWHPVRREMIIGKRSGNTTQVHLVSSPLAKPKQLTTFPDPVGGGTFQLKTGDYFLFSKATGGNEVSQLFRYDINSGNVTRITTDDKKRNGGGPWSSSGDLMVYTSVMTGTKQQNCDKSAGCRDKN